MVLNVIINFRNFTIKDVVANCYKIAKVSLHCWLCLRTYSTDLEFRRKLIFYTYLYMIFKFKILKTVKFDPGLMFLVRNTTIEFEAIIKLLLNFLYQSLLSCE